MPHHDSHNDGHRLADHTAPTAYQLHIVPHPLTLTFDGVLIVHIVRYDECPSAQNTSLTLHALRLQCDDVVAVTDPSRFGELDLYVDPEVREGDPTMFRPIVTTVFPDTEMINWTFPTAKLPTVPRPPPQPSSVAGCSPTRGSMPSSASSSSGGADGEREGHNATSSSAGSTPPTMALRIKYRGHIQSKATCGASNNASTTGEVSAGVVGLFQSESAVDGNFLAVQSEPTHARCFFPCFDEPQFKSPFQLSVDFDAEYEVIGPTLVLSQSILPMPASSRSASAVATGENEENELQSSNRSNNGPPLQPDQDSASTSAMTVPIPKGTIQRTIFEKTPPLSSYLIAFSTGKFQTLQQSTKRGLLCRILFPRHEVQNEAWYALHLLVKAVEYFEDFFQMELDGSKLDIVAMTDLQVLGMENWGVISILKDFLLVNETTSIERRQRIARLVAHEVAHQWYGNTVSIEWWSQLWLKEGFCRYLEFVFVNDAYPRWFVWCDFIAQILDDSLVHDCRPNKTHPVELRKDSAVMAQPRRIFDAFDVISYGKGASILKMLVASVGDDVVRRALQILVRRFKYGSFQRANFEQCVQEALRMGPGSEPALFMAAPTSRSIATPQILDWVSTSGHPLLYVQRHPHRGAISISQYVMPDLQHGVVPQLKIADDAHRQSATPRQFSLTSAMTPRLREFLWSARQVLSSCEFKIPIQAVELLQGQSSVRRTVMVEAPHIVIETHSGVSPSPVTPTSSSGASAATPPPVTYQHRRTPSFGVPVETTASLIYFNYGGSGVFRVDYDHGTWLRVMELAPFLTAQDRITITVTLFRLRTMHVGKIVTDRDDEEAIGLPRCAPLTHHQATDSSADTPPSNPSLQLDASPFCGKLDRVEALSVASHSDRCTLLLEWLVVLSQQRFTNASLWKFIVEQLEPLLYMLKGVPCWGIVAEFITSLLHPFLEQGRVTFRTREKTVEFQSQNDLSQATVLNMLLNLSICRCATIVPEAIEICDWVLGFMFEQRGGQSQQQLDAPLDPESRSPNSNQPSPAASFAISSSTANTACSMTATLAQQGAAALASMQINTGDDAVPFDIRNDNDVAVALCAMQCTVESGDSVRWWRCAAILSVAVNSDLSMLPELLTPELLALVGPLPLLDSTICEIVETARHRWINILAPAVFCTEDPVTFPVALHLFRLFTGLSNSLAKALLRNTKLLTYLLEECGDVLPSSVRHALTSQGGTYCSHTVIVCLLRGDKHHHHNQHQQQRASLASEGKLLSSVPPPSAPSQQRGTSSSSSMPHLKHFERMEENAVWVDYVGDHYMKFLREKKSAGCWHTAQGTNAALSHSDPPVVTDNKMACGISI